MGSWTKQRLLRCAGWFLALATTWVLTAAAKPRPPCPTPPKGDSVAGWVEALQPTSDHLLRWCAAGKLGDKGDKAAVIPLVAALSDVSGYVRHDAMGSLGRLKDARAVDGLIAAFDPRRAPTKQMPWGVELWRDALSALTEIGAPDTSPKIVVEVRRLLAAPEAHARMVALRVTMHGDERDLRGDVEERSKTDPDENVRGLARAILARWARHPRKD